MTDKSMHEVEVATSPASAKKSYERPVLTKLGALRDLTLSENDRGNRDGRKNRNTGRGGMNGLSQDSAS